MVKNMGNIDRGLRVVVGVFLIILAVTGTIGVWGWLGLIPLGTALVGTCPAYLPFGIKTCKTQPKE
ncbi:DUF2892 domain-containing protein [Marinospirillum sp.]|uniref:YgaP family membrane protein n=1 Tax=Marinospirillum sp. TaxID=2183934 RepID=UPI00286FD38D|nr:DUF2892 domain-containing protein [Marinospirillum sp.]MDR9467950.1 DUF2892 domain-containing protein [Marinospirillum sp.]